VRLQQSHGTVAAISLVFPQVAFENVVNLIQQFATRSIYLDAFVFCGQPYSVVERYAARSTVLLLVDQVHVNAFGRRRSVFLVGRFYGLHELFLQFNQNFIFALIRMDDARHFYYMLAGMVRFNYKKLAEFLWFRSTMKTLKTCRP
jgi:hypothetical protein